MREILFKAKRKSDGKWIFGNLLRTDDDGICIIQNHVPHHLLRNFEVEPDTICQYTGLTDKNGNKIWENDIVYIPYIRLEDSYCKVIFRRGQFIGEMADGCEDSILNSKAEVIGNIFDNADLVKE